MVNGGQVSNMTATKTYYTADEFFKISHSLGRCELIDGEIRQMSPAGGIHGKITVRVSSPLFAYVEEHNLGVVFAAGTGYIIRVCFISVEKVVMM